MTTDISGPANPSELQDFARHAGASFNIAEDELITWLAELDDDSIYALRHEGRVVAGCIGFRSGHYLLSNKVSSLGIALVFVAPHVRGLGLSTRLLSAVLERAGQSGYALSTLHPARLGPYRALGYELAGSLLEHRIELAGLHGLDKADDLRVDEMDSQCPEAVELFERLAPRVHGALVRDTYLWRRVRRHRSSAATGYCVRDRSGGMRGFFFLRRTQRPEPTDHRFDLWLGDVWADSGSAYRTIASFLGSHSSMAAEVGFFGSPADPLVLELPENRIRTKVADQWMVKVLDPRKALAERAYPRGLQTQIKLRIGADPINLAVANGQAEISDGTGDVEASTDLMSLAPMVTGLYRPSQLQAAGRIEASSSAIAILDSMFASPHPHMRQYF